MPSELSKEASKRPNFFKTIVFFNVFLPSRLFASDGLLRPQDGSKMVQDGPKRVLREAQDGPKNAQERAKRGPRGDVSGPEGGRK